MKKLFFLALLLCFAGISARSQTAPAAQNNPADTSQFPYWVQMMQDPSVNFFKVQRAFNLYWQNRPITKGCGWKVFKRWEYMMQSRVLPNGDRPAPELAVQAYEQFLRGTTSSNGNWNSLGPGAIPAPGPAGYEGLGRVNVVAFHPTDPSKIYIGAPSGGMWQTADGGTTWVTHTDTLPTLGVSSIIVDYSSPNTIFIGTGDRDAGDAAGLGVYKSTNGGLTWAPSKTGMGDKVVGTMIQNPANPSIILAATSGGVYRTTNGGTSWTQSMTGNFLDISFKPGDPSVVYAATSSQFWRSNDNGASFYNVSSGLPGGQRTKIAVTPANPNYVYILYSSGNSGFGGLYRSTDSGLNFTKQSDSPNIMDWSCDGSGTGGQGWYDLALAADPADANTLYVGGVNVWKSANGGVTWTINSHWYGGCSVPAVHADCHYLVFSPVDGHLYAGNDGGTWSSGDGGTTWTWLMTGVTIGQIYKLGQAQLSKNHVINGFQDNGTYTLTPSGWVATGGGDGMECAIDYNNDAYTYHTIYYGDIYRRYNNGSEHQIAGNGVNGITESGAWVTPFTLHATDPNSMFIGYKNIWRTNNVRSNNPVWQKISNSLAGGNGSDMSVVESSASDPNLLYAARSDNRLFRSDNCLDVNPTWIDITSSLPVASTPTDVESHPTDPNKVYMTVGNTVYKSADRGLNWTNITGNLPAVHMNCIAYYKNDNEGLYVGSDAGVFYKNASMTDWVIFSKGLPANAKITELQIYYDNDSVSSDVIRGCTYGRGLWGSDMFHAAPAADFTADRTNITAGCSVDFTDLSTGVPTSWQWTFTGGTPSTSTAKNPSGIHYNTPGTYPVQLTVSNTNGSDVKLKNDYITVGNAQAPLPGFSADKVVLCEGDVVHFFDESDFCPITWTWEFSPPLATFVQGTNASSQDPVVRFDAPGLYTVRLTVSNSTGTTSLTKDHYIAYGGYVLPFTDGFEDGLTAQHWTILNSDNNITWDTITVAGTTPGNQAVWMNLYNYTLPNRDQLISPPLNFSTFSTALLTFQHAYAQHSTIKDSLIVKISEDCGSTWTRLLAAGPNGTPNVFATHAPMSDPFYPQSDYDWCGSAYGTSCYSVDLNAWAGKLNVKIMFESYNRRGNNLFLDNISISGNVGVADQGKGKTEFRIYPNPSSGDLTLFIPHPAGKVDLSVLNMQGQQVAAENFMSTGENPERSLDLSTLARGVYFVRIVTDHSSTVTKIILQ
jgi:PKD repeat protein